MPEEVSRIQPAMAIIKNEMRHHDAVAVRQTTEIRRADLGG